MGGKIRKGLDIPAAMGVCNDPKPQEQSRRGIFSASTGVDVCNHCRVSQKIEGKLEQSGFDEVTRLSRNDRCTPGQRKDRAHDQCRLLGKEKCPAAPAQHNPRDRLEQADEGILTEV